jgi:urea transport system permease protein
MPDPVLPYHAESRPPHRRVGAVMLLLAAAMFVLGVPALYGAGAVGITTVNQLGRFLAVVIAAIGLDLVWGYAGILSMCQAMFFVFGGYAIGMHMALHGPLDGEGIPRALFVVTSEVSGFTLPWFWKPFQTLPVAVILGLFLPGLFAFFFGYFTFRSRVRGVYFSIITQATTFAATYVFRMNNMRLCGTNGLTNFVTLAGFDLQSDRVKLGLYVLTALCLVGAYLAALRITTSRLGRLLQAVRDNESRLRFAGYQPVTFKVFVFVAGAVMAGLAGMLYTPQNGIITPYKMVPEESIMIVAYVAIGGRGTLSGAVVGTLLVNYMFSLLSSSVFYSWLPPFLKVYTGAGESALMHALRRFLQIMLGAEGWPILLGAMFVAVTLFAPEGIVGAWRRLLTGKKGELRAALEADAASASAEEGAGPASSPGRPPSPLAAAIPAPLLPARQEARA